MNYLRKCRVSVGMSSGSSVIVEALELPRRGEWANGRMGEWADRRIGGSGNCHEVAKQISPELEPWVWHQLRCALKGRPNPADAGCNSKLAQHSNTPSLRVAGFEEGDDDEDSDSTELAEVLSDVAFCARWLAVLSAREVGRTKRLPRAVGGRRRLRNLAQQG
jgi:hypothetical protein